MDKISAATDYLVSAGHPKFIQDLQENHFSLYIRSMRRHIHNILLGYTVEMLDLDRALRPNVVYVQACELNIQYRVREILDERHGCWCAIDFDNSFTETPAYILGHDHTIYYVTSREKTEIKFENRQKKTEIFSDLNHYITHNKLDRKQLNLKHLDYFTEQTKHTIYREGSIDLNGRSVEEATIDLIKVHNAPYSFKLNKLFLQNLIGIMALDEQSRPFDALSDIPQVRDIQELFNAFYDIEKLFKDFEDLNIVTILSQYLTIRENIYKAVSALVKIIFNKLQTVSSILNLNFIPQLPEVSWLSISENLGEIAYILLSQLNFHIISPSRVPFFELLQQYPKYLMLWGQKVHDLLEQFTATRTEFIANQATVADFQIKIGEIISQMQSSFTLLNGLRYPKLYSLLNESFVLMLQIYNESLFKHETKLLIQKLLHKLKYEKLFEIVSIIDNLEKDFMEPGFISVTIIKHLAYYYEVFVNYLLDYCDFIDNHYHLLKLEDSCFVEMRLNKFYIHKHQLELMYTKRARSQSFYDFSCAIYDSFIHNILENSNIFLVAYNQGLADTLNVGFNSYEYAVACKYDFALAACRRFMEVSVDLSVETMSSNQTLCRSLLKDYSLLQPFIAKKNKEFDESMVTILFGDLSYVELHFVDIGCAQDLPENSYIFDKERLYVKRDPILELTITNLTSFKQSLQPFLDQKLTVVRLSSQAERSLITAHTGHVSKNIIIKSDLIRAQFEIAHNDIESLSAQYRCAFTEHADNQMLPKESMKFDFHALEVFIEAIYNKIYTYYIDNSSDLIKGDLTQSDSHELFDICTTSAKPIVFFQRVLNAFYYTKKIISVLKKLYNDKYTCSESMFVDLYLLINNANALQDIIDDLSADSYCIEIYKRLNTQKQSLIEAYNLKIAPFITHQAEILECSMPIIKVNDFWKLINLINLTYIHLTKSPITTETIKQSQLVSKQQLLIIENLLNGQTTSFLDIVYKIPSLVNLVQCITKLKDLVSSNNFVGEIDKHYVFYILSQVSNIECVFFLQPGVLVNKAQKIINGFLYQLAFSAKELEFFNNNQCFEKMICHIVAEIARVEQNDLITSSYKIFLKQYLSQQQSYLEQDLYDQILRKKGYLVDKFYMQLRIYAPSFLDDKYLFIRNLMVCITHCLDKDVTSFKLEVLRFQLNFYIENFLQQLMSAVQETHKDAQHFSLSYSLLKILRDKNTSHEKISRLLQLRDGFRDAFDHWKTPPMSYLTYFDGNTSANKPNFLFFKKYQASTYAYEYKSTLFS